MVGRHQFRHVTLDIRDQLIGHERVHLEFQVAIVIVIRYADRRAGIVSRETRHGPTGWRPAPEVDAKFDDPGFGEVEAVFSKSHQGVGIWIGKPADDTSVDPRI